MSKESKDKIIRIKLSTYDKIAKAGKYGQTFNEILDYIVDEWIKKVNKK